MTNSINVSFDRERLSIETGKRTVYVSFKKDPLFFSEALEGKTPKFRNVVSTANQTEVIYSVFGRPVSFSRNAA